ncbi:protein of unknown function [Candidatus Methylomirabilis oxygeniifera]|uniref:Uncharacterized protein n=1 Tax=Methylomirabilis oxygeniifera TaxID=671143 RepID=D5MI94_METO1|nr:protein of unknown function [Candidatus Methylomirabilis oxyfera]
MLDRGWGPGVCEDLSERTIQHRRSTQGSLGPEENGDSNYPRVPQHAAGPHPRSMECQASEA